MSLPRFCVEVSVPREGWKVVVLQLYHGAILEGADEATVDLHCKTVCFNQLFEGVKVDLISYRYGTPKCVHTFF